MHARDSNTVLISVWKMQKEKQGITGLNIHCICSTATVPYGYVYPLRNARVCWKAALDSATAVGLLCSLVCLRTITHNHDAKDVSRWAVWRRNTSTPCDSSCSNCITSLTAELVKRVQTRIKNDWAQAVPCLRFVSRALYNCKYDFTME